MVSLVNEVTRKKKNLLLSALSLRIELVTIEDIEIAVVISALYRLHSGSDDCVYVYNVLV